MSSADAEYVAATGADHFPKGDIELHFIPTEYQLANIFTKAPIAKSIISYGLEDPDDLCYSGPRWEPLIYRTTDSLQYPHRTKIDIEKIIYNDHVPSLVTKTMQKRKKKTQTMTKPKSKSQGPEACRALPQKEKKAKTKKTTLK
ncbi:hypothetical protein Tco_0015010 [Tanacetum coccineum]